MEEITLRTMTLTSKDPCERVRQFCDSMPYSNPGYNTEMFQNGILCRLTIWRTYELGKSTEYLREVRFVEGNDREYAKKVVAAVLLERIGLGVKQDQDSLRDFIDESGARLCNILNSDISIEDLTSTAMDNLRNLATEVFDESRMGCDQDSLEDPEDVVTDDPEDVRVENSMPMPKVETRSKTWADVAAIAAVKAPPPLPPNQGIFCKPQNRE